MNERIREILIQCQQESIDGPEYPHWTDFEKFAEMIVKECAGVIAPMGDWCGGHGEPSMPSTMECAKRLKQHFGVKE